MAVEALAAVLPFVWALPLLVAAYKMYTQGRTVGPTVLLALAISIMAGVLIPELAVKYAVSWSIATP